MDVAVLEPRDVLRCGLAAMLGRLGVVGRLESHPGVGELLAAGPAHGKEWCPDIVLAGCTLNGDAVDLVRSTFSACRVLKLVASAEPSELAMAARTQAHGYVMLYDATELVLDQALRALMRGEPSIPQPITNYLFERVRSTDVPAPVAQPYFSPSERNVIELLLDGLSNQQIAARLGISLHSAKRRVSAVLHKANSPSRAHFVAQMLREQQPPQGGRQPSQSADRLDGREAAVRFDRRGSMNGQP